MNTEVLEQWLAANLPQTLGLDLNPTSTCVRHILNWGGFVNHSFSIDDGSRRYHLKITSESDSIRRLQQWHGVHGLLEQRYRAPQLIAWLDLEEIGFSGLLFQQVDGEPANFCESPALVEQLIELAARLHKDAELRSSLNASQPAKTYLDYFVETYIERFTGDLETIGRAQLPFMSSTLFGWMRQETERLHRIAKAMPAFHLPAVEPVHGDLNEGNVLVTLHGWFVVDWDDLALGDPAIELAILIWPMIYQGRNWRDLSIPRTDQPFAERIEVCLRAQLLDEVIDSLADHVESEVVPSKQAAVQLAKRKRHEEALTKYRALWRP